MYQYVFHRITITCQKEISYEQHFILIYFSQRHEMCTNMLRVWEVKKPAYFVLLKCPTISWTMQLFQNAVSIDIPFILFSKNCLGNLEFLGHTFNIIHLKLMFGSTNVLPPNSLCWHWQTQKADWGYTGVTR